MDPGECQAAPGDSGGAAFVFNEKANRWELGGVVIAVDSKKGRVAFGDHTYIGSLQAIPKKRIPTPTHNCRKSLTNLEYFSQERAPAP